MLGKRACASCTTCTGRDTRAPTHPASSCASHIFPNLLEFAVAQVVKQEGTLGIGDAERMPIYLRIHVAVGYEDVLPAIVVKVEKFHTKGEKRNADRTEVRCSCKIGEFAVVVVVIEIVA